MLVDEGKAFFTCQGSSTVEQLFCNQQVVGPIPSLGSMAGDMGEVPIRASRKGPLVLLKIYRLGYRFFMLL